MEHSGERPDGVGPERGTRDRGAERPLVPLVARDDRVPEPADPFAPTFLCGSERPVTAPEEAVVAAVPGCSVVLSSRVPGTLSWLDAWRAPTRCTATVTGERVVFGCRPYRDRPGHPQAGKVLGGHLGFRSISRVGIWVASDQGDSHLLFYGSDRWRQWRLAIGSPDLTREGSPLAEEIAVAVARRHLALGTADADQVGQLLACADGVRLRPAPGHGITVTLPGELRMPVPGGPPSPHRPPHT
jgi:hypothetical protein